MYKCPYTVAELLPHAPPMILVDEVVSCEQSSVSAFVIITKKSLFYIEKCGVPSYVGLEYMAQTCGLFAGIEGREQGQAPRLGFLLGTRNFHTSVPWFRKDEKLIISVTEILRQDTMGVFDCRISVDGTEVASAQLNLYQPSDPVDANQNL